MNQEISCETDGEVGADERHFKFFKCVTERERHENPMLFQIAFRRRHKHKCCAQAQNKTRRDKTKQTKPNQKRTESK